MCLVASARARVTALGGFSPWGLGSRGPGLQEEEARTAYPARRHYVFECRDATRGHARQDARWHVQDPAVPVVDKSRAARFKTPVAWRAVVVLLRSARWIKKLGTGYCGIC